MVALVSSENDPSPQKEATASSHGGLLVECIIEYHCGWMYQWNFLQIIRWGYRAEWLHIGLSSHMFV